MSWLSSLKASLWLTLFYKTQPPPYRIVQFTLQVFKPTNTQQYNIIYNFINFNMTLHLYQLLIECFTKFKGLWINPPKIRIATRSFRMFDNTYAKRMVDTRSGLQVHVVRQSYTRNLPTQTVTCQLKLVNIKQDKDIHPRVYLSSLRSPQSQQRTITM